MLRFFIAQCSSFCLVLPIEPELKSLQINACNVSAKTKAAEQEPNKVVDFKEKKCVLLVKSNKVEAFQKKRSSIKMF